MEGVLIYNYYEGSDPEDFYKVWFRGPEVLFYPDDIKTHTLKVGESFYAKEFTVGGPKCLIKW